MQKQFNTVIPPLSPNKRCSVFIYMIYGAEAHERTAQNSHPFLGRNLFICCPDVCSPELSSLCPPCSPLHSPCCVPLLLSTPYLSSLLCCLECPYQCSLPSPCCYTPPSHILILCLSESRHGPEHTQCHHNVLIQ